MERVRSWYNYPAESSERHKHLEMSVMNKRLVSLVIMLLALASCDRSGRLEVLEPLLGPRWLLTEYVVGGVVHPIPTDPIPYLDIGEDWLAFGNGCNTQTANHEADGERWHIELSIMRGIDCGGNVSEEAVVLETTAFETIGGWTTYSIEGDTLLIALNGGELRFRRSLPDNPAGLRAFPLWREPAEGFNGADDLAHGRLVLEAGCIYLEPVDRERFEKMLIVWPERQAVGFDDEGVLVYSNSLGKLRMGDAVVVNGSPLADIQPSLDASYVRLETIPESCAGPYWLIEDVQVLE